MTMATLEPPMVLRGAQPGELTLAEVGALWGFGRTRTWELVTKQKVVPYRQDRFRIYVQEEDARNYRHEVKRGRPPETEE